MESEKIVKRRWIIWRRGETGVVSIQRIFEEYALAAAELIELSASIEATYWITEGWVAL